MENDCLRLLKIITNAVNWQTTSLSCSQFSPPAQCYCGCSTILYSIRSFFLSFLFVSFFSSFFHFPTEIYTLFSSAETSAIDLKLQYNVQNGLNSRSRIIGDVLRWKAKITLKLNPDRQTSRGLAAMLWRQIHISQNDTQQRHKPTRDWRTPSFFA